LRQVDWGELDYLIVDMPPGTGDVQLSLAQMVSLAGAVLVTTPQEVALGDVRKAYNMFEQLHVPVLGVVENMSYFECPNDGAKFFIFGNGGGEALAQRFDIPFLGAIPIAINIREGGDLGIPVVISEPDGAQAQAFQNVAQNVAAQISIGAMKANKALPVLNLKK
jgi:ATP-binding protein involved in chromosome partitioning